MDSIFDIPVHPAAEIFPMLAEDELNELAEDIKANGLVHPIVVKDGILIDGRNRREACRRAGVTPASIELNGQDPATYIFSSNINRRHLTKSQQYMAIARLFPEPQQRGRSKKGSLGEHFSKGKIAEARTILKWTPSVADAVLAGIKPLSEAYEEARNIKDRADELPARLSRLQQLAPDLADLVKDEKLSLNEAMAAADKRKADERIHRQGVWHFYKELELMLALVKEPAQIQDAIDVTKQFSTECPTGKPPVELLDIWINGLRQIRKAL